MDRLRHELAEMAQAALFFGTWIAMLLVLKQLILAEYDIAYHHVAMAVVGALILSKVVLLLEHVPLGAQVRRAPAWVDVLLRTTLYAFGVLVVLVLERGIDERQAHGGFLPAVFAGFGAANSNHVLANTIALTGALLAYNALAIVRRHLPGKSVLALFASPVPDEEHPRDAP